MKIKVLICDIDGTLLQPDHGIVLKEVIANALISLQQQGITIILASARIFQGVYPIAKQLQMDVYGGYILSSNGGYAYDMKQASTLFVHGIEHADACAMSSLCAKVNIEFAIAQPNFMIASKNCHGFMLDHHNCNIDYKFAQDPKPYLTKEITKCSASSTIENLDIHFASLKQKIEAQYPYTVVRSTPYIIDIMSNRCGKAEALAQLFKQTPFSFEQSAAIGDGDSDAAMLQKSAYSATLENGSALCKQYADMIVDDCKQDGCLQFFQKVKFLL